MKSAPRSNTLKLILALGVAAIFVLIKFGGVSLDSKKLSSHPAPPSLANEPKPPAKSSPSHLSSWPLPSAAVSDDDLLGLARQYVAISPERAIAWAQSAEDTSLRERLLFAALRAWGEKDPTASVGWALGQDEAWRFKRMEAALKGAVAQPAIALQIGRELLASDAISGNAYDTALVGDFILTHQFQIALKLASAAPAEAQRQWSGMIFRRWAEEQPREALAALNSLPDGELRPALFQSAAAGWANNDPASLAQYAVSLPTGESRSFALNQALEQWLMRDPVSLGEWLNTRPPGAETDAAAALLITRTDQANRSTQTALGWVEQIEDLDLRASALEHVLSEWAQTDLDASRQYLANVSWITPEKRKTILEKISLPRTPDGIAAAPE